MLESLLRNCSVVYDFQQTAETNTQTYKKTVGYKRKI